MPFAYHRTIRLADTDAAGVVYFARTLSLCHEAYEEALAAAGIKLRDMLDARTVLIPVTKSEADYLRMLTLGDKVRITVTPEPRSDDSFVVRYEVFRLGSPEKIAARVRTEHVCTAPAKRDRAPLPADVSAWVNAG